MFGIMLAIIFGVFYLGVIVMQSIKYNREYGRIFDGNRVYIDCNTELDIFEFIDLEWISLGE
jgi:hypothetical protein